MQTTISFIEKPATAEEKQIAGVVQKYLLSLRVRDYNALASLFTEDAQINSLAAGDKIISCDQFVDVLRTNKIFTSAEIQLNQLRIGVTSAGSAVVSGYHRYFVAGQTNQTRVLEIKFKKNTEKWLITELRYHAC